MALNKTELSLSHASGITGVLHLFFSFWLSVPKTGVSFSQFYTLPGCSTAKVRMADACHLEGDYRLMAKAGTESVCFHPNPSLSPRYWVWILLLCLIDWIWTQGPYKCKLWQNSSFYSAGWTIYEILKIKVILIYSCNKPENVNLPCHFVQILLVLWYKMDPVWLTSNSFWYMPVSWCDYVHYQELTCWHRGSTGILAVDCFSVNVLVRNYFKRTNWKACFFHSYAYYSPVFF